MFFKSFRVKNYRGWHTLDNVGNNCFAYRHLSVAKGFLLDKNKKAKLRNLKSLKCDGHRHF